MSDTIVTYSQNNKNELYDLMTSVEKTEVNNIVTNFIQELVTKKGSSLFDPSYGTMFIDNLGFQVNIYKLDYFLKKEMESMKDKYRIESGSVTNAWVDVKTGVLNIEITIVVNGAAVSAGIDFEYSGTFTDKDIIEYN